MRVSKKQLIAGAVVLMSLITLAGCGDSGKVGSESEVKPVPTPQGGVLKLPASNTAK